MKNTCGFNEIEETQIKIWNVLDLIIIKPDIFEPPDRGPLLSDGHGLGAQVDVHYLTLGVVELLRQVDGVGAGAPSGYQHSEILFKGLFAPEEEVVDVVEVVGEGEVVLLEDWGTNTSSGLGLVFLCGHNG